MALALAQAAAGLNELFGIPTGTTTEVLLLIPSLVGIILVVVFFVTSSDSGSLVIDTIAAGGKVDAPVPQRMFWCIFEAAVAIALLLGGGLIGLQAMVISTGLPFTLILLLMCYAVFKGLRSEMC